MFSKGQPGWQGEGEDLGLMEWLHACVSRPDFFLMPLPVAILSLCSAIKLKSQKLLCPNSLELKNNFE